MGFNSGFKGLIDCYNDKDDNDDNNNNNKTILS